MNPIEKAQQLSNPTVSIISSSSVLRDFIKTTVWMDFREVLHNALQNIRDELETMGSGTGYTSDEIPYAMAFYQGQAFQIRQLLELPGTILTIKSEEESDERS